MASFKSYEPSEAMMEALRAKCGAKMKADADVSGAPASSSRIPEGISASATTGVVRIALSTGGPSGSTASVVPAAGGVSFEEITQSRALPQQSYVPLFRPSDNPTPAYASRLAGAEPALPNFHGNVGGGPSIFSLKGGPEAPAHSPVAKPPCALQSPSKRKLSPKAGGRSQGQELQPRARAAAQQPPPLPQGGSHGAASASSSKPPVAPPHPRSSPLAAGSPSSFALKAPSGKLHGKPGSALEELARFSEELGLSAGGAPSNVEAAAGGSAAAPSFSPSGGDNLHAVYGYGEAADGTFDMDVEGGSADEGATLAALSRAAGGGHAGVPKIPSAVCMGGIPVASDGGLIYLGGGLYASSQPPREPPPVNAKKPRPLPGRVKAPPRRKLGGSSAIRSASAHLLGKESGSGVGDVSPAPSRSHSDGQLNTDRPLPPGPHSKAKPVVKDGQASAWRPSGASKKPPTPEKRKEGKPERHRSMEPLGGEDRGVPPGASTEARAEARREQHRQAASAGLFGKEGLLAQLRDGEAKESRDRNMQEASMMPFNVAVAQAVNKGNVVGPIGNGYGAIGAPSNSTKREADRRAAKEAKIQMMLEERAVRLGAVQAEQEEKRLMARQRALSSAASAPELPQSRFMGMAMGCSSEKELESQKMRVAAKMQFLDIFNGYGKDERKESIGQAKALLQQLQQPGSIPEEDDDGGYSDGEDEQDDGYGGPQSVEARLRQMNDACNVAFEQSQAAY